MDNILANGSVQFVLWSKPVMLHVCVAQILPNDGVQVQWQWPVWKGVSC